MLSVAFYAAAAAAYTATVYVSYRILRTIFALLGAIFVYLIVPHFYRPGLHGYRSRWTVVSGGTDGIGRAYVRELARRGLRKFVLVGRSEKKLEATKSELGKFFGLRAESTRMAAAVFLQKAILTRKSKLSFSTFSTANTPSFAPFSTRSTSDLLSTALASVASFLSATAIDRPPISRF